MEYMDERQERQGGRRGGRGRSDRGSDGPGGSGGRGGRGGRGPSGRGGRGPRGARSGPGGPAAWGDGGFGFGPPRGRGGQRLRRGDIRTALLAVLAEAPGHGYELIGRLEEKSNGAWRPSPGSVYPTLQLLEDEGMVVAEERDGRRVFSITDDGRVEADARLGASGTPPWERFGRDRGHGELREAMGQLGAAVGQVASVATDEQRDRAVEALREARKRLYAILAED